MNITKTSKLYEVELLQGKRYISYGETGYSYWYNGKEVCNKEYSDKSKWKKIKKKYNKDLMITIERNKNFNWEMERKFSFMILKAIEKEKKRCKKN